MRLAAARTARGRRDHHPRQRLSPRGDRRHRGGWLHPAPGPRTRAARAGAGRPGGVRIRGGPSRVGRRPVRRDRPLGTCGGGERSAAGGEGDRRGAPRGCALVVRRHLTGAADRRHARRRGAVPRAPMGAARTGPQPRRKPGRGARGVAKLPGHLARRAGYRPGRGDHCAGRGGPATGSRHEPDRPEMHAVDVECPWPGLAAYGPDDSDCFFGRDAELAAALAGLATRGVLAVVGPSGVGKSSFLGAGVVATLRARGRSVHLLVPAAGVALPACDVLAIDQAEEVFGLAAPDCDELLRQLAGHPGSDRAGDARGPDGRSGLVPRAGPNHGARASSSSEDSAPRGSRPRSSSRPRSAGCWSNQGSSNCFSATSKNPR